MNFARRLILRGALIISATSAISVVAIVGFLKLAVYPTSEELRIIIKFGLPVFFFLALLLFLSIIRLGWPMVRFLLRAEASEAFSDDYLQEIQTRAIKFGYYVAVLSFIFYLLGTPACVYWAFLQLGWSGTKLIYTGFAGFLAGLLNIPLAIYGTNILMREMIEQTFNYSETLPRAARLGFGINIRKKLIIAFLSMILASVLYASLIGYINSRQIMDEAKKVDANKTWIQPFEKKMGDIRVLYIFVVVFATGLALLLSYLSSHDLNRPVQELLERSRQIAEGNLDQEVTLVSSDELAELAEIFNRMVGQIQTRVLEVKEIISKTRDAIRQLDLTSNVMLSVSTEQSSGAIEQASALEQVSATAEEIAATAKQIEEQANQVDKVSKNTLGACEEGTERLSMAVQGFEKIFLHGQTVFSSMENLEARFQEMFRIIELIEDISEQTDLLALNAALEAAGAGEAGRRFSVVAQATRRLANQVAGAASEIRTLITTIQQATQQAATASEKGQKTVEEEKLLIDDTAAAIERISMLANNTSMAVKEITLSTQQQTSGTEQMANTISEIQQVSTQAAEGAKEIEKTVKDINKLMNFLRDMIER
jgi:methyl-accepting chemotaxis protein